MSGYTQEVINTIVHIPNISFNDGSWDGPLERIKKRLLCPDLYLMDNNDVDMLGKFMVLVLDLIEYLHDQKPDEPSVSLRNSMVKLLKDISFLRGSNNDILVDGLSTLEDYWNQIMI